MHCKSCGSDNLYIQQEVFQTLAVRSHEGNILKTEEIGEEFTQEPEFRCGSCYHTWTVPSFYFIEGAGE